MNRIIYNRDNIDILKGLNTQSIDLIYLDPPFNKNKTFTAPIGSSAEGASFKDTFKEEDVKSEWVKTIKQDYPALEIYLNSIKGISEARGKHYLYNYCYLCYMAIRLIEMKRILKDTGSIYYHCDSTMSHYIKILMGIIFGEKNFRNEIVWCYNRFSRTAKKSFPSMNDIILFYTKTNNTTFNKIFTEYRDTKRLEKGYHTLVDNGIKKLLVYDEKKAVKKIEQAIKENCKIIYTQVQKPIINNIWDGIAIINPMAKERTGYPTQKPLALLERIIKASSNEGDVVLDPFCGCATTCVAAEKLDRNWIGIDVSHMAYDLVKQRLIKEVDSRFDFEQKGSVKYTTIAPTRTDEGFDNRPEKYVYIISHPMYRYLKVGIASDVKSRLSSYQTGSADRAYKMEFTFKTPYFNEIEKYIHEKYNVNAHEWVGGSLDELIGEIKNYKFKIKK